MAANGDGPPDSLGKFTVTTPPSYENVSLDTTVNLQALNMLMIHLGDLLDQRFVNLDKRLEYIQEEIADVRLRAHQRGLEFEAFKTDIEQKAGAVFTRQQDWSTQTRRPLRSTTRSSHVKDGSRGCGCSQCRRRCSR